MPAKVGIWHISYCFCKLPGLVKFCVSCMPCSTGQNKGWAVCHRPRSSRLADILALVQRATGDSFKVNLTIGVQLSHAAELIGIIEQVSNLLNYLCKILYSFGFLYSTADQVAGVHSLASAIDAQHQGCVQQQPHSMAWEGRMHLRKCPLHASILPLC